MEPMELIVAIATIVGTIAAVIGIIPILRQRRKKHPTLEEISTERLRVLAVIPSPVLGPKGDTPPNARLDIWKEWQNLEEAVKEPHPDGRGKPIALTRLLPPTRDRLRRALADCDVVHFAGHGTTSALLLETEHGREELVSSEDFAKLFAGSQVKLVVMSACNSHKTAGALHKAGIPAVICTQESVLDTVALRFATHFYADLTDGKPFVGALETAKGVITREFGAADARNFTLVGKGKPRLKRPANPAEGALADLGEPKLQGTLERHGDMVNRGAELVKISEYLERSSTRLVIIHGIGGIGKSYIAADAAHRNAWRFPDGILWITLKGRSNFQLEELCRNICYLFDIEPSETQLEPQAHAKVSGSRCLLVIDNAESIPVDERPRIARFLGSLDVARGSKVILTARERMAAFNELDGALPLEPKIFADDHAEQLLKQEAVRQELWEPLRGRVAEFIACGRGHPFLLTRSVRWAKGRGVEPVLRELKRLKGRDVEAAAEELVGRMAAELSQEADDVLRRMPIFEGGGDEAALHAVCGENGEKGVPELIQRGLLDYDQGTKRYTLQPLVLDYVREKMKLGANDERTARGRHAAHYLTAAALF
jgi:hypothetical protein